MDFRLAEDGRGKYARDEDGDGFHEIPVNAQEGCWSLLRSWLRPIVASRRRNYRCIWTSFSLCITSATGVKA